MKTEYHNIQKTSLLYHIIEEMLFLVEARKLKYHLSNHLYRFSTNVKLRYKKLIKNELTQASLLLTGYMTLSSLLLFVAYKLVLIF